MSLFRKGLILATLLLSACSMPIIDNSSSSSETGTETETTNQNPETQPIAILIPNMSSQDKSTTATMDPVNTENETESLTYNDVLTQYNNQKTLAESNYNELKNRVGSADDLPSISINTTDASQQTTKKALSLAIQELRSYTSQTNTDLAKLEARIAERQALATNGDLIRVFLSKTTVAYNKDTFNAQPLVGQWVRGEARVIRLKNNILFDSPKSEALKITFSETSQLIVNEQIIATVNPNQENNSANFSVPTQDTIGTISGQLDYRIENTK